jgi:3-keto-5-aminohexanoate cleavage enzyme
MERGLRNSECSSPVAIAIAPNGGRRTKADHHTLPMTPRELADAAAASLEAGACMIHVHARDTEGRHPLDAEAYRDVSAAIRHVVGDRLLIQITSEALGIYEPKTQMDVVRAVKPEAVSLELREFAPDEASEPAFAEFLA